MWQNWTIVFLGFFVVLVPFINFSLGLERIFLIVSGTAIIMLGFWAAAERRGAAAGKMIGEGGEDRPDSPIVN